MQKNEYVNKKKARKISCLETPELNNKHSYIYMNPKSKMKTNQECFFSSSKFLQRKDKNG